MSVERITKNVLTHEPFPFTSIFNEMLQGITNTAALGVYCYLASKPSGWIICKKEIQKHFKCGRDHINSCFKYLKEIGAIEIQPARGENGKISCWNTLLKRHLPTIRETHIVDNPHCGNTAPIKERILEKKEDNKNTNKSAREKVVSVDPEYQYPDTLFPKPQTALELLNAENNYKQKEKNGLVKVNYEQKINDAIYVCKTDMECRRIHIEKFPANEILFERLLEECRSHYVSKDQVFDKYKFIKWIENARIFKKSEKKSFYDNNSTKWIENISEDMF